VNVAYEIAVAVKMPVVLLARQPRANPLVRRTFTRHRLVPLNAPLSGRWLMGQ